MRVRRGASGGNAVKPVPLHGVGHRFQEAPGEALIYPEYGSSGMVASLKGYFNNSEPDPRKILIMSMAILLSTGILALFDESGLRITGDGGNVFIISSFGATALIVYATPSSPFAKPKSVFFGHLFSAMIGVVVCFAFERALGTEFSETGSYEFLAVAVGVTLAVIAMVMTGVTHPPGGATALTCVYAGWSSWEYVLFPVMVGVVIILAVAYFANRGRKWCDEHPLPGRSTE